MEVKPTYFYRCIVLFVFFSNQSFANNNFTCATTHYPPYTIYDEATKKFTGLDLDIITPLFKSLDIEIEIINLPWARLKEELKKDNFDCYFSLGILKEREEYLDFTAYPMHITKIAIFHTDNSNNSDLDFSNKIIGVHRGINIHRYISKLYGLEKAQFYFLPSNEILFGMLEKKRVDAVITNQTVGSYILSKTAIEKPIKILTVESHSLPTYLAFRKGVVDLNFINPKILKLIASSDLTTTDN